MKKYASIILAAAALLTGNAAQAVTTYNATTDFQLVNNPNAVWSYGYSAGTGAYSFTAFNAHSTPPGTSGWSEAGYNDSYTPGAWVNNTSATLYGATPGQLSLHAGPTPNGDSTILRFTAAQTGDYNIVGQFYAGDTGAQSGTVLINGSSMYTVADTTNTSSFSFYSQHLTLGQTVDFVVGNNGSFGSGTTPLAITITAVPEPETYAMMLAGLFVMGALAKRKRSV